MIKQRERAIGKRAISLFLAAILAMGTLCIPGFAVENAGASTKMPDKLSSTNLISKTEYAVTPGVTEYEMTTNNDALTEQQSGHVLEVNLNNPDADIIAGYSDYNLSSIQDGKWSMKKPTEQAAAAQTRLGKNVVAAVNGDFYNMTNGRPVGVLIMNGKVIQNTGTYCFWVDTQKKAHITSVAEAVDGKAKEAVGGGGLLVQNGEKLPGQDDGTTNPRTAVGIKADGTVLIYMVDGRQAPYSHGLTLDALSDMMLDLGCTVALNLDGGGSSVFATQRSGDGENATAGLTVRSRPSDGYERSVSSSLLVLSTAVSTDQFDHAEISPKGQLYTPGSSVQFTAKGVNSAGSPVSLPDGLSWQLAADSTSMGTMDAATGTFTANTSTGTVHVELKNGNDVVGTGYIEIQKPDKLSFSNSSVSLDFGQESSLYFTPTYQGRPVNYKDGDFKWTLDVKSFASAQIVDPKTNNTFINLLMEINENSEKKPVTLSYSKYGSKTTYESVYQVSSLSPVTQLPDGSYQVTATVDYVSSNPEKKPTQTSKEYSISLGAFHGNKFTAPKDASMQGEITVSYGDVTSAPLTVVSGLKPKVLMDFEDEKDANGQVITPAEDYWKTANQNGDALLTQDGSVSDSDQYRLWCREVTAGKGLQYQASLVSEEDGAPVRFGSHAEKISYDFTKVTGTVAACFGFADDVPIGTPTSTDTNPTLYSRQKTIAQQIGDTQPTAIGLWIYVPEDCANQQLELKSVVKGGAYYKAAGLTGTTAYMNYYSYDENGAVTGSKLADWAGKGWIWVQCDLSQVQMPIDLCRAYTVRIVLPNSTTTEQDKNAKGEIYLDNLQFLYGTNPNDTVKPSIDGITETTNNQALAEDGSTTLKSGTLNFEATFHDDDGPYASGIDAASVHVFMDGVDITDKRVRDAEKPYSDSNIRIADLWLPNGQHTIEVRIKDGYGNETTMTRKFMVAAEGNTEAALRVEAKPGQTLSLGENYALNMVAAEGANITYATLRLKVNQDFRKAFQKISSDGFTVTATEDDSGVITATATNKGSADTVTNVAELLFAVPTTLGTNSAFTYEVLSCSYTVDGKEYSFSAQPVSVPVAAAITIESEPLLTGIETVFTVKDAQGASVSNAAVYDSSDAQLGTTDSTGQLRYTPTAAGKLTLYAVSGRTRSYVTDFVVHNRPDHDGTAFHVLNNAVLNPETEQSITWFTGAASQQATTDAKLQLFSDSGTAAPISTTPASNKIMYFTQAAEGDAVQQNTVRLSGLTPGTTYYYKLGTGTGYDSAIYSFTTAKNDTAATTNFFVLGDIQTTDTSRLDAAIDQIAKTNPAYDFGIQTGDVVDSPLNYDQWNACLGSLSKAGSTDLIHVLGNHEYYGDPSGSLSSQIFDLPEHAPDSYYSMEYGDVYVAVINYGATESLDSALKWLVSDAKKSTCTWKVLAMHEPVYGTVEKNQWLETNLTKAAQDAGLDFVLNGNDHAYVRTDPMVNGEKDDSGVVYYICGDLSDKNYAINVNQEHFAIAKEHSENGYLGMFLSVSADKNQITLKAVDYQGNELDSYTKYRTACAENGKHTFLEDSVYDLSGKTLTCTVCHERIPAAESKYTGFAKTGESDRVFLSQGIITTGWFPYGDEMYHAGTDGILHPTTVVDTRTCTESGKLITTCSKDGEKYESETLWAKGHTWDENHVCTVCGTVGVDISQAELKTQYAYYSYTGSQIRPSSTATYQGEKLSASSDRYGADAYISYGENTKIGEGTVTYEGRGKFYGTISSKFTIVPQSVATVRTQDAGMDSITLAWDAAAGAGEYLIQQMKDGKWVQVGTTQALSFTIGNLAPEAEYEFRVYCRVKVAEQYYYCISYSKSVKTATTADLSTKTYSYVTNISQIASDGKENSKVNLQKVDGKWYLFLPSSTDLQNLNIQLTVTDPNLPVTIKGSKASVTLKTQAGTVDLLSLTDKDADGSYPMSISVPDRDPYTISVMKSSSIMSMYLTSDDPANTGRGYVEAVKGNSATGKMLLLSESGSSVYDGTLTQLKCHGNSTYTFYDKKSYQIKLNEKTDLLGTGETVKTWVLLAGYGDATQMHDKLVKDLARELEMPYAANCDWVDLYYDGEYRGTYLLSEKNAVDSAGVAITDMEKSYKTLNSTYGKNEVTAEKTNQYGQSYQYTTGLKEVPDVTGGYLLELNHDFIDEASGFHTRKGVALNVKSPEWAGDEAMRYISEYYQEFEDAVYAQDANGNHTGYNEKTGKYYYEYCDLTSLVQTFLLQELTLNPDGFISSLYFYKDAGGLLHAGPVWDFDMAMGTGWGKYISSDTKDYHYLAEALIQIPGFQKAVQDYYSATFAEKAAALTRADGFVQKNSQRLADSTAMNYRIWPYVRIGNPENAGHLWPASTTFQTTISDMTQWLTDREKVLNSLLGSALQPSGGSSPTETITIPVSSDTGTVHVSVSVSEGTANVSATDAQIKDMTDHVKANGTITVDVSGMKDVKAAKIPSTIVSAAAKTDFSGGIAVKLPTGTITLNQTALEAVQNSDVTVSVERIQASALTDAQKLALGNRLDSAVVMDVSVLTNGEKVSNFNGGKITVSIPYTPKSSENTGKLTVLYIQNDGTIEKMGGHYDSKNKCFVFDTTHLSRYVLVSDASANPFADVADDVYYYDAVLWAVDKGVTSGTTATTFAPNSICTRAQTVTFLWRAMGSPEPTTTSNPFTDVKPDAYYYKAVLWAMETGITKGTTDATFDPDVDITRSQAVTLLHRAAGTPAAGTANPFTDVTADVYYADAVLWAVKEGITSGTGTTTFSPVDGCSRAEIVTFLYRYLSK